MYFRILVMKQHVQLFNLMKDQCCTDKILELLNYWYTRDISFIIISPSFFSFLFNYLPISVISIFPFLSTSPLYFCPSTSDPPPPPTLLSAGRRPVWRQILSWTRTSARGWVWAAATPSPTAATVPTWQPPNAWPSVSSTWTASGSPMLRATSARSELLESYGVVAKLYASESPQKMFSLCCIQALHM